MNRTDLEDRREDGHDRRDERAGRASPWPVLVAFGLAASEVGVVFGFVPLAVGGVVLFGRSCAGAVAEAGYASTARALGGVGAVCWLLGGVVWLVRAESLTVDAAMRAPGVDGVALRGVAVLLAGVVLLAAAGVDRIRRGPGDGRGGE